MTQEEYDNFIQKIEKQGYKYMDNLYDAPYYSKAIEWRTVEDGKDRAVCQLLFYVYCSLLAEDDDQYSFEPVICISRNADERIDITLSHPKQSVEEYERIAVEFMKFIDNNVKLKGGNEC